MQHSVQRTLFISGSFAINFTDISPGDTQQLVRTLCHSTGTTSQCQQQPIGLGAASQCPLILVLRFDGGSVQSDSKNPACPLLLRNAEP